MRPALVITLALAAWAGVEAGTQVQTKVFRDDACSMQVNAHTSRAKVCEKPEAGSSQRLSCLRDGSVLIQTFRGETCGGSVVEENIVSPRSCQQGRGSTFVSMTCVEVEDEEEPAAPSSTATGAGAPQTTPARAKEQYWALRRGDGAARKQAKVQQPLEGGSDSDANPLDAEEGEGVEVEAGPGDRAIDSASRHGTGIHGRDDKREPEVETGPEPEPERPQPATDSDGEGEMKEEKEEEEEEEKEEEEEDEKAAAEYGPDTAAKAAGEEPQFTMRVFHTSRCSEEVDRRSRPAGACFKLGMESQRFVPEREDAVTVERFPQGGCHGPNGTFITLPLGRCAAMLGTPLFVIASAGGEA